jgi:alkylation response protein AidB-like acyl-CoA dehydrogenase
MMENADNDPAILEMRTRLREELLPNLKQWQRDGSIPRALFETLGREGLLGLHMADRSAGWIPCSHRARIFEETARISAGVAIAILAHVDLGFAGLHLFGSRSLQQAHGPAAVRGETILCLGNTEGHAGSDVAAIKLDARAVKDGWRLNGTKAYVTNGAIADYAVITAVTDPDAPRNQRLSMFWVDLDQPGVTRRKLRKNVWMPSDLTRLTFKDAEIPAAHLMGTRGRGLQQVLTIFTHSRVPISALTLGSAAGAMDLALERLRRRQIFGRPLSDFQAKAFEAADYYTRLQAARAMVIKACQAVEAENDFRLQASMAKYLAVEIARQIGAWTADLFGAASVMADHPAHRFPLDAWASSLGEGTQDIQKLIIARHILSEP